MAGDGLTGAVVEVWRVVLGTDSVGPTEDLVGSAGDHSEVVDAVSLTNQWVGGDLTVGEAVELRTAARMAAALGRRGAQAPGGAVAGRAVAPAGDTGSDHWRRLWNTTYRFANPGRDNDLDTAGWFAASAPVPMVDAAMREWRDTTVARLALLSPASVLDVGCGSGMVLSRLAPVCEHYVGVDFAQEAVDRLFGRVRADPALAHVDVTVADAVHAPVTVGGRYDLVLLNSVIQYFPDRDYLVRTIDAARSVLTPTGAVFLGDVHNRDLKAVERLVAVAARSPGDIPAASLREVLARPAAGAVEMALAVTDLAELVPDGTVRVLARRGRFPTPMNRFRFDALLSFRPAPVRVPGRELTWSARPDVPAFDTLTGLLADAETTLVVRSVPDARTAGAVRLLDALAGAPASATLAGLVTASGGDDVVDPDRLWRWGDAREVGVAVAPGAAPGLVDVALWRGRDEWAAGSLLR